MLFMNLSFFGHPRGQQLRALGLAMVALAFSDVSLAQTTQGATAEQELQQLRQQIVAVQLESQRKLEELQRQTDQQMQELQARIASLTETLERSSSLPAAPAVSNRPEAAASESRFAVSGDFRLRYETNSSDGPIPSWDRGVLRGRVAATYQLNDQLSMGARLATGDADNPRTTDTTISDFGSDFEISLDQAYVAWTNDRLFLTGGKFAKPFTSTELVWDGDVNPQGLGGYYDLFASGNARTRLSAIYFPINESIFEDSSSMAGGQLTVSSAIGEDWNLSLSSAYYDYEIGALSPTVPGGARGNNVTVDQRHYVSDFNLWDTVGTLEYRGLGDPWNIRLVADYVRNLGAEVAEDSGYGADIFVGDLQHSGHFLFRYGYAQVETDAVLGMFSNDNIVYPTNYELHTFSVDYALQEHTFLGLTSYLYRHLDWDADVMAYPNDWVSRTRLNLYFTF